jgi:hypothetical protein
MHHPLDKKLAKILRQLLQLCAEEQAKSPRAFKDRVLWYLRANLPPYPGRPPSDDLNRIEALRNGGLGILAAIERVNPEFRFMNSHNRATYVARVRDALRKRRKRRPLRKWPERVVDNVETVFPDEPAGKSGQVSDDLRPAIDPAAARDQLRTQRPPG